MKMAYEVLFKHTPSDFELGECIAAVLFFHESELTDSVCGLHEMAHPIKSHYLELAPT